MFKQNEINLSNAGARSLISTKLVQYSLRRPREMKGLLQDGCQNDPVQNVSNYSNCSGGFYWLSLRSRPATGGGGYDGAPPATPPQGRVRERG